ncbi:hypothetical protein [Shimazuella alba]|uniref:Filamentation induced by cAMP protein Fic n=1 Tax=Shimazuella alba TaxID=2690964 RepID=A0A6I4VMX1_9BACL|nr:hypothetical protein [Shimazuella alba]MXQ52959.1 hypothetical protein [Shimazuella alba]
MIINFELMKQGYPPVILPVEERVTYYEALQKYDDTRNPDDFLMLFTRLAEKSLAFYLS